MTTQERLALCNQLADEAERTANSLFRWADELRGLRDDIRDALRLTPILDKRQRELETA